MNLQDIHRREDGELCVVDDRGQLVPLSSLRSDHECVEPSPPPPSSQESQGWQPEQLDLVTAPQRYTSDELDQMTWGEIRDACEAIGLTDKPDGISWKAYYLQISPF